MLPPTRRQFLSSTTAASTAAFAPAVITSKRTAAQDVMGGGDFQYKFDHRWVKLPEKYRWQITHAVAVDPDNNLYVIHEGDARLTDHPSIFVFDSEGKFVRAFGEQFQGGGHGIEVHVEKGTPYLYVASYQQTKTIAKLSIKGELVWQQYAPIESGLYSENDLYSDCEPSSPAKAWGRNQFLPTNFAFLDDGFLVVDGYGSFHIHRYDYDGNWISAFGGPGKGKGKFNTPHGIWIDSRKSSDESNEYDEASGDCREIVVCDRANSTLQTFDLNGTYRKTVPGFGLPANADTFEDLMVVPELVAQISILDRDHNVIAKLGSDQERVLADKKKHGFKIRTDESTWQDGKFIHPHDACFDLTGNLFVAEWVKTGRVTRLERV